MKFARYLHDTQTPEWTRAYIDYRGLKKCIGAIRAEQIAKENSTGTTDVLHIHKNSNEHDEYMMDIITERTADRTEGSGTGIASAIPLHRRISQRVSSFVLHGVTLVPSQDHSFPLKTLPALHELIPLLPPLHAKFFESLDFELEKIDSFYAEREKEMQDRGERLKGQLSELGLHRQKYYELNANATELSWLAKAYRSLLGAFPSLSQYQSNRHSDAVKNDKSDQGGPSETINGGTSSSANRSRPPGGPIKRLLPPTKATGNIPPRSSGSATPKHALSPQEYQHAKKGLRKAIIEHYRGLEVLNNYRILNLTGFRKALKKYGKVTKVSAQAAYMKERVEPSAFASGVIVSSMLKEMEELFAARFERGDKKKAIIRLRIGLHQRSHHFSTFRTGMWLGLSIPAIVTGLILSMHSNTQASLHAWDILLFIYSIFLIPTLLALLVGLNLVVWARERINYVFIFELDVRSRLDHREYFELPAFLLCALAYCFLLSFLRLGSPLIWPLVWLVLVLIVMFNPIPNFLRCRSRWWLIRNSAKLGLSGFRTVEFTDFWLGDQFCSLVYSLSNFYFIGCLYARYFPNIPSSMASSLEVFSSAYDPAIRQAWITCGAEQNWAPYFALGTLPYIARFLHSIKRYWESRLPTHLINAGKYGIGIMTYFCYFRWRRDGNVENHSAFILWCLSAIAYALYGCAWDFLMDWSICKPRAKYPLLRQELVYTSQVPLYYLAAVMNFAIRFIWIFYIPPSGPPFTLRTFIAAVLEMLRRIVWNFYRLENEHLGNMDQYRVTRELPLPYPYVNLHSNEDEDEDEEDGGNAEQPAS